MRSRNEAHQFIRPIANLPLNRFQILNIYHGQRNANFIRLKLHYEWSLWHLF